MRSLSDKSSNDKIFLLVLEQYYKYHSAQISSSISTVRGVIPEVQPEILAAKASIRNEAPPLK